MLIHLAQYTKDSTPKPGDLFIFDPEAEFITSAALSKVIDEHGCSLSKYSLPKYLKTIGGLSEKQTVEGKQVRG